MTDHQLRLSDTSGVLQYILTDYLWLSYTKTVNYPGIAQFGLSGDHPAISDLADKWKVEILRRDADNYIPWTSEFEGLYREPEQAGVNPGEFAAIVPGCMSMLDWRVVAWPAGTSNRSYFTSAKAETIMKTLVNYNAGSPATLANGRIRTGTITGLSVEADSALGNTLNWYCAGKPLLKELQELAQVAGGDYDLVRTGANAYQFRWYTGQRGTDRSASVIFAIDRGNMGSPYFRIKRLQERTVAIVAGQGEGSDRDFVVRTGANYSAGNDIEDFVDARNVALGDTSGLNAAGDKELATAEAVEEFGFDVLQTPSSLYGLHYFFGDLVTALSPFTGSAVTRKVRSITISADPGGDEIISVELGNA